MKEKFEYVTNIHSCLGLEGPIGHRVNLDYAAKMESMVLMEEMEKMVSMVETEKME